MSTYSSLKFELILTGDQSGQWGNTTNTNIGTAVEQAIVGMATLTSANFTTNVATLALADTNAAQNARALCLNIDAAALSAAGTINVPAIQKPYIIINGSSYTVTVKVSGQTGVAVPSGKRTVVYNNGTDVGNQIDYLATLALGTALPATSGGTAQSTYTTGDTLYSSAANTLAKLAGNTTTTRKYLVSVGDGTNATAPAWDQIDISTSDITGTLAVANGGTGATTSTGSGAVVLATSPTLVTPALGTPTSGNFSTGTFTWPTFNQNTTGYAAGIAGGAANRIAYQSGSNTTTFIAAPTTASTYLSWDGSAFAWAAVSGGGGSVPGGLANQIVYQSAPSTSTFVSAPTTASTYLSWNGSTFVWTSVSPSGSTFAGDISVNGLTVGRGTASIASNTALGYQANNAVTTSTALTSVGYQANALCTTSERHTAIGYQANSSMTNMGSVGLDFEGNTAVGHKALASNIGFVAFTSNTAVGAGAAQGLTTGYLNTSIGSGAGPTVSTASSVCVGYKAGYRYQGANSVIIGSAAYSQVQGAGAGNDIVVVGYEALYDAALGTSGATLEDTTAVGSSTLHSIDPSGGVQSYRNTAVGSGAGYNLLSGTNNTLLGYNAQASTTTASNEFVLGNSSVSVLRCQVSTISGLSDARDKYDIEDLPLGLDFINLLKARRFKWDKRDAYFDRVRDEDGRATQVAVPKDGSRKSDEWNEGFIAQEVDEVATAAGADWMRIVHKANPERLEMAPGKLIPVLVKAIQELTARLEALEARN